MEPDPGVTKRHGQVGRVVVGDAARGGHKRPTMKINARQLHDSVTQTRKRPDLVYETTDGQTHMGVCGDCLPIVLGRL
jgi:hypothetical protein